MLIDWFTVVAQIVNFLILIWLLKRFLYGPILRAVDAREAAVAARVRDAEAAREEAKARSDELRREREAFEDERSVLMERARTEVEAWRERAEERVRGEVEARRVRWLEALDSERAEFERALAERVATEVLAVSRRALSDLGDSALDERIASAFLREVRAATDAHAAGAVRVGTGTEVGASARTMVDQGLREVFPKVTDVAFVPVPELGLGMRLETGDTRLCWTLDGYLDGLEERVLRTLSAVSRPKEARRERE
ncbi:F-type H+-transporting ATPase subunit b [Desulfobaculum xiamenense]|uniref:ATP synthase subunit b n=1 Tax=Desulfobaculum xiamenense TaxID=995050 RepID=A0A846QM24_9BACT|nr:F-type H+-transporting ATPase subunit b [Desulfobaculum xiamenense]